MIDFALRPMSTSELLDRTFYLYRNNFFLFAGIAALPQALALVMKLLLTTSGMPVDYASPKSSDVGLTNGTALLFIFAALISLFINLIATQFAYGGTVYSVSRVHLGKRATIRESYRSIWPFLARLVGVSLLVGLRMAGIGVVLVIVVMLGPMGLILLLPFVVWWGVYVYARCCLGGAACVLEGETAGDSIGRSRFLTLGGTWRIFLVLLLTGVLSWALGYALGFPAEILKKTHFGTGLMVMVTKQLGEFLAQTFVSPIGAIALVLVYYDQRIRKEAFDLEVMMQAMDRAGGQPAATSTIA